MNLLTKQRETDLENELWLLRGGMRKGIVREFGTDMHTLCLKWITNKDLLYSTWNSAQCCMAAWMGGETRVCMAESLCRPPETATTLLVTPIQNEKLKKKIELATDSSLDQKTLGREFSFTVHLISNALSRSLLLLSCFSRVRLCATPLMAAHQALLSLGFSRQEYWSGLPFPSPTHESLPPNNASETLNEDWFSKRIFQTLLFKPVGENLMY